MLQRFRPTAVAFLRRFTYLVPPAAANLIKGRAEVFFWNAELVRYRRWYDGETLYGLAPPGPDVRVTGHSPTVNAATTWLRVYQLARYREALDLPADGLAGQRVLDVGCGPFPSLLAFDDVERHGLDPLVDRYRKAGYPLDLWSREGFAYHDARAESLPFPDDHFDTVVSVNAIDHVDDFGAVAREIRRVLRPGGGLRLQINFHPATVTEPVVLDDETVRLHFGWVPGLRKVRDEPHPTEDGERLTLWLADEGVAPAATP